MEHNLSVWLTFRDFCFHKNQMAAITLHAGVRPSTLLLGEARCVSLSKSKPRTINILDNIEHLSYNITVTNINNSRNKGCLQGIRFTTSSEHY